ncbi:DnaD domain-containing protein [Salinicoccus albus]|uniref:DnaD domain-containing protein n=1 Tax=Salinicoccus albus TaxID=418756 RepID=UPI00036854BA|nr:DnaD domain protein [Salinicoccus albus]
MTGWISLHRSVEDHWMFKEKRTFSKFEAWVALLLMVNHKDGKTTIGNQLIEVKRGQRITSIKQLSENWRWSRTKVKAYLEMLKDDEMIDIKTTTKYTLVTIANYDFYQSEEGRKNTQKDINQTSNEHQKDIRKTSTKHQKDTNNNDNNELIMRNNDNNDNKTDDMREIISFYENNGYGTISQSSSEEIDGWYSEGFEKDAIILAFKIGADSNNRTMKYIRGILNNWRKSNTKTVAAIEAEENKRKVSNLKKTSNYQLTPDQQAQIDRLPF